MARRRKGEERPKLRMNTVYLSEFHYALIDYLCETAPGRMTRSDVFREAVEPYLLDSPSWDPARFKSYMRGRAEEIEDPHVKDTMLMELEHFCDVRISDSGTVFQLPDPADLDIATTAATFRKYGGKL